MTMSGPMLGILSDSHGHADTTAWAVAALLEAGATTLVHLGDVGTEAVIDELVGHQAHLVFGNCDFNDQELGRYATRVGVSVDHPVGELALGGRRVVYTHGHLGRVMAEAMRSRPDYLLHGHTHERRDERIGGVRVINPGALFRAAEYTVAVLDPDRDLLRVLPIGKPTGRRI